MNRPAMKDGHVRMPEEEFEELLELAAERGARRALADVGLVDEDAASDIRDLRSLLGAVRIAKRTALADRRPPRHHRFDPGADRWHRHQAQDPMGFWNSE